MISYPLPQKSYLHKVFKNLDKFQTKAWYLVDVGFFHKRSTWPSQVSTKINQLNNINLTFSLIKHVLLSKSVDAVRDKHQYQKLCSRTVRRKVALVHHGLCILKILAYLFSSWSFAIHLNLLHPCSCVVCLMFLNLIFRFPSIWMQFQLHIAKMTENITR